MATSDVGTNANGESAYPTLENNAIQPSAPALEDNAIAIQAAPAEILPTGWRSAIAPDGRTYYIQDDTKTTQWHKPVTQNIITQQSTIQQPQVIQVVQQPQSQIIYIVQKPQMIHNNDPVLIQPTQSRITQQEPIEVVSAPMTSAVSPPETEPQSVELTVKPSKSEPMRAPVPKLDEFNFAKLVPDKLSRREHMILFICVLSLWLLIASTIAFISTADRALSGLIVFVTVINFLLFVCLNPMYFKSFRYKYHPKYVQDILMTHESDLNDNTVSDINPSLSVQDATAAAIFTPRTEAAPYTPPKTTKCGMCQRAFARLIAFAFLILVPVSLTMHDSAGGIRAIIFLLWCIIVFIFCFKLMSHFGVYYGKQFWRYNFVIWLLLSVLILITRVSSSAGSYIILSLLFFVSMCLFVKYGAKLYKKQMLHAMDPTVFGSTIECNAQCNVNDMQQQEEDTLKDALQIKTDTRVIGCCCNRVLCGFKTCVRAQITVSAIAWWLMFGLLYLAPIPWIIFPMVMYLYCALVWNAMYYSKIVVNLKKRKCCCTCSKWLYYCYISPAVLIGAVLNTLWFLAFLFLQLTSGGGLRTVNNAMQLEGPLHIVFFLFIFATIYASVLFYLPSTGFCFHTVPVHFVISHLFASMVCFIIPISIFFETLDLKIGSFDLKNYDPAIAILFSAVIVVTFVSISGASCSCYRFRKSLLETQHYLTTSTGFSKGTDTKEVSLTWIRISTFILTFADFFTDTIWTFDKDTFRKEFGIFRGVAIFLWLLQILVQLISAQAAIKSLRAGMLEKDQPTITVLKRIKRKICVLCCGCCCYMFVWLFYMTFIIVVSVIVSVTKLLAIQQVREWWLSLIIADYDQIKMKQQSPAAENKLNEKEIIDELMTLTNETTNPIWKFYYWIESKSPQWMIRCKINASVYNNYLISELIVESIPLLVLNIVNATDNKWTTMSIISATSSTMFILYGLLKVAYYVGYKNWDLAKFVL